MLISARAIRFSLGAAAASALLAVPMACSDDTTPGSTPEAGTGSGGDEGTGGKASTGGKAGGGATATGGMMSSGGQGGGAAGAGGGAKGGSDAGGPETGPGVPEAGTDSSVDGGHDAGPPPCSPPENANDAKVCLTWKPDTITPVTSDPNLDLVGLMIIQFFDTPNPATGAAGFKELTYPSLPDGGGLRTTNIHDLPQIDVDGLPETVYMRVIFVDNVPGFFSNPTTLTWGLFVGGFDLTAGVVPKPALRKLTLKKGAGTLHLTSLTALRKFSIGSIELATGTTPPDDGQGPLSVGAFNTDLPSNAPVLGGVELGCKNITAGPIQNVTGFLYGPGNNGNFWIGAQLDDYNQGGTIKPGFIVSLGGTGGQTIMDSQKVTLTPDQYSVTLAKVSLNYVIPISGTPPAHYACP